MNRKALAALVALVLTVGLAETGLRLCAESSQRRPLFEPDPILGFRMRPGIHWRGQPGQFTVNEQGLRNSSVPARHAPGEYRALFLGDSVTVALAQRPQETFVEQCGAELQRLRPGRSVRVINAGIDGYGTAHMLALLKEIGPLYRPDVVIVTFYAVDTIRYIPPDPNLAWKHRLRGLLYRSELIQRAMLLLRRSDGFNRWPPDVAYVEGDGRALLANIDAFEEAATRLGCPILFVLEPRGDDPAVPRPPGLPPPREGPAVDIIQGIRERTDGRGNAAVWLDDQPLFRALKGAGMERDARHLTAQGHEVVGRIIADVVVQRGW